MTKREKEEEILAKFIYLYNTSIRPVYPEDCKIVFPNYNNENPDFIIRYKNDIIGIELVELLPKKQVFVLLDKEEEKLNIRNNAHLKEKIPEYSLLFEVPELVTVALVKINNKIEKAKNYVTNDTWLLGYGTYPNSLLMLRPMIDDNEVDSSINYIFSQIEDRNNFSKIFLFEDSGKSAIIEMDFQSKHYTLHDFLL